MRGRPTTRTRRGVFVDENQSASDVAAARNEAISYAAFRVLEARYLDSIGATESIPEFDLLMSDLCYPIDATTTEGDTPSALGNRIARVILDAGMADGSNEAEGYASPGYDPVNPALTVDASGTALVDPNRWQPLQIENMISQNGVPLENGVQESIDPHWGYVVGFALPPAGENGVPIDPGDPPYVNEPATDQEYRDSAVEVVGYSSILDPRQAVMIDISPATLGANPLGTNDGTGYDGNPVTGSAYEPDIVNQGDFGRTVAEFWADGPDSETPPGHWNTMANAVTEQLGDDLRIGGAGEPVDALEWDVKLYLALNGANHDAAIAAWGTKGYYDYIRPISMIRWMGGLGQSSDPDGPSYAPDGLPLDPGLVEVVTAESAAPGERHAALADHEGEIAVLSYAGNPPDPETEIGGVQWILAVDWVPYQAPTFVTPSFSGYVSGHSTFSRASAEVLTGITGTRVLPGRPRDVDDRPGRARVRGGNGQTASPCNGPPTRTHPIRRASRASTAASTCGPTTSRAGASERRLEALRGTAPRRTTEERPDDRAETAGDGAVSMRRWLVVVGVVLVVGAVAGVLLVLNTGGPTTPTEALPAPHFVEEAEAAGVVHAYDGDWTFFVGGGVAVFDCNDDRKPDLYFAGGVNPAALYVNESPVGGALRFSEVDSPRGRV